MEFSESEVLQLLKRLVEYDKNLGGGIIEIQMLMEKGLKSELIQDYLRTLY